MTTPKRGPRAVPDKPEAPSINLDTLETEGTQAPFVFILAGKRFEVSDLESRDWQDLMEFDSTDPQETLQLVLGDQYEEFRAIKGVSMRKIKTLLDSLRTYFGIGEPPEGDASPG